MIKEKDDPGSKKHSGKHSEKAEKGQKSESREVRKSHPSSPEVRKTCRGRMEDRESRKAVRDRLALQGGTGDFP